MSLLGTGLLFGIVSMSSAVDTDRPEGLGLADALEQGSMGLSARARYEDVSLRDDRDAQSPTLSTKISYSSERYQFFSAQLEYTFVNAITGDDNYFDGSNGQNDDALVADPDRSFFSRYSLAYDISNTVLRYGRQNLHLDNGRFFGTETHRQGGSQVRGLTFYNESLNFLSFNAGHLNHFDSAFGSTVVETSPDLRANYFNAKYSGIIHSELSFYSYSIDGLGETERWDTQTDGIRFAGKVESDFNLSYAFEIARQKNSGDNDVAYSTRYSLVELGVGAAGANISAGYESLGAEGDGFFVTPLASLHDFQGDADVFSNNGLGNITGGISDKYLRLTWDIDEIGVSVAYHRYEAEERALNTSLADKSLGEEWNARLAYQWQHFAIAARYADYDAHNFGNDTRKSWIDLSAEF